MKAKVEGASPPLFLASFTGLTTSTPFIASSAYPNADVVRHAVQHPRSLQRADNDEKYVYTTKQIQCVKRQWPREQSCKVTKHATEAGSWDWERMWVHSRQSPASHHRLNGSSSPVLTATCLSYGSLCDFLGFFPNRAGGHTHRPILTQNGSNDVDSRTHVPFGVKIATFCNT